MKFTKSQLKAYYKLTENTRYSDNFTVQKWELNEVGEAYLEVWFNTGKTINDSPIMTSKEYKITRHGKILPYGI